MVIIKKEKKILRALALVLCVVVAMSVFGVLLTPAGAAAGGAAQLPDRLIAGGVPFGVKFSTGGVVVIGFCDIDGIKKEDNPAYSAGLRPKDVIIKVDGQRVKSAEELSAIVEGSEGRDLTFTYTRAGREMKVSISPRLSESDKKYKSGIWVRDSGAGIGTVTYVVPGTLEFGGLGHGICDGETGELVPMNGGVIMNVNINAVKRGVSGVPGEIKGYFGTERNGNLKSNTECGVFGVFDTLPDGVGAAIPVGTRDEISAGEATLVCTLANGQRREYGIEISSVNREAEGSKCFLIKVTDPELIEKSGGIVQGMSGSPIIQNGKLVGAVTHVMINDPTTGYGIFIENMLNAAQMPMQRAA